MPRERYSGDEIVLRMIERAIEHGDRCPSNNEIATAVGATSCSRGANILTRLERLGIISVARGGSSRVVTILATGKKTAGEVPRLHWRFRAENAHRRHVGYSMPAKGKLVDELPIEPIRMRVIRDPCPRCGTRADIGCAHHASSLTVTA